MVNELSLEQGKIKLNKSGDRRGLHPNTLANLSKPGQTNNPGGRPKDVGLTPGQVAMLDEVCPFDAKGRTWRRYLEEKGLIQVAQSPRAMGDFKDRLEGKVTDIKELKGELILRILDDEL